MTDMQRYEGPAIPRDQGSYVLASDAEAAIAAAEQRSHAVAWTDTEALQFAKDHYAMGQRDMLAKCIAAVEALDDGGDTDTRYILASTAATLRSLQEKP